MHGATFGFYREETQRRGPITAVIPDPRALFLDPGEIQTLEIAVLSSDPQVRWIRFKCAVALCGATLGEAARYLGVSFNHMREVALGNRRGSMGLQEKIAAVIGERRRDVFGDDPHGSPHRATIMAHL